jgi:FtsP/CotA-like multicopper oxidase with cupredoxin domain
MLQATEAGARREGDAMLTRRDFFRLTGATTIGWYAATRSGWVQRALAAIPGGTLQPGDIDKYVTPLLIPPVMPRAARIPRRGGKPVDSYEISMKQFQQQILPEGMPPTTVWGYGAERSASKRGLLLHNAPSLTIEARWNRPVRVRWINGLKDDDGTFLPHLLPVDPTLHWANPPQGSDPAYGDGPRDSRPTFAETPGPYTGPVPIVTHVHGSAGVGDESDGYAEAWYLPDADGIPPGYATEGTWYDFFAGKADSKFGARWGPGFATFQYPNDQRASTLWYHDHALGLTRLNVYAGPAGFFLIRGGPSGDEAVLDRRTGTTAVLPGPAPREGDKFPPNKTYFEIPIAIQDRSFNLDGSLFYPDSREFFDEATAEDPGFIPDTDLSPIWNPEFFGNMIMVNGNTWPFLDVQQRRYRFRFLNGCQSRFLILDFNGIPGVEVWQIGNEGGFLAAPVSLTADHGNRLLIGLAERADLIVDFTHVPVGQHILANVGPDEPFGGGEPGGEPPDGFDLADPDSTGQIMAFNVGPATERDPTTPPHLLLLPPIASLPKEDVTRPLALLEEMSMVWDGPAAATLGTVGDDGTPQSKMWADPVSENPSVGDTEVWEFYNFSADAHPMHIHEVAFEVINRQALATNEDGETVTPGRPVGDPRPPEAWESGFKDTVTAYPGEVTRLKAKFDTPGQFVWHCHIVEHEDNEMMRPYRIGPEQQGQPT